MGDALAQAGPPRTAGCRGAWAHRPIRRGTGTKIGRCAVEPILFLIVVAVIANLVVMAALAASPAVGRARRMASGSEERSDVRSERAMAAAAVVGGE